MTGRTADLAAIASPARSCPLWRPPLTAALMCARRFLAVIFVLTLLAVAAAFGIYQWGSRVLLSEATPKGHFVTGSDARPNYTSADMWIARPGSAQDPSDWLPAGISRASTGRAAIFYIHPTTYLKTDRWNAPLAPGGDTEFRTSLFVESQASAFNQMGQIWAPRYRQAAYGAFLLKSADAQKALDLAYSDVSAAFDEFVREAGNRPIILAGHSQGALHLERLLTEKVARKPIASKIVAAYVVGWPISVAADLPALGLQACTSPTQARCILSWMTFREPANPDMILHEWSKTRGLNGKKRRQEDVLCVNPISGTKDGASPMADNPGVLVPTADLSSATLQPQLIGAHCNNGLLIADGALPAIGPYVLPGNNYHVYDYALFWGAVRRDASRRLASWQH